MPAVIFPISCCANRAALGDCLVIPARIRSSSISTSSGSTMSLLILIEITSPGAVGNHGQLAAAGGHFDGFLGQLSLGLRKFSCIFCACFIIFWIFMSESLPPLTAARREGRTWNGSCSTDAVAGWISYSALLYLRRRGARYNWGE